MLALCPLVTFLAVAPGIAEGAADTGLEAGQQAAAPIPDTEIGLAKGSVFYMAAPPEAVINATDPGDGKLAGRAFASAPPRVPHLVADFLPITRDDNLCVECHTPDWRAPDISDPTAIPVSHYVDLRADTDEVGAKVVGARWVCVSCHVVKTEAPLLVGNSFTE